MPFMPTRPSGHDLPLLPLTLSLSLSRLQGSRL